ncbi:protein of unknown function [Candidatus Nitrospira inopinata]|uniref:Uncharacterized protein n=1 Tax=Candidatus Nitrospira inopinata TaxID=1715989 RepID=A0A0S4KUN1_9BACT|nr:protein of unknown function [Candidatus Nitrospira inopinata]
MGHSPFLVKPESEPYHKIKWTAKVPNGLSNFSAIC